MGKPRLDLRQIQRLRPRQKTRTGEFNGKYSPGALVALEGAVQLLQVMNARHAPQLDAPHLSVAIESLQRGNAQDLFLPKRDGIEFVHLARRMGYEPCGDQSPADQLAGEIDERTNAVRAFVTQRFGRGW